MPLVKLKVEQLEKVKPTVNKPVEGYLFKKGSFSFEGDNGGNVTLLELKIQQKDGKKVRAYLTGSMVDLEDKLTLKAFTRISKREVIDTETKEPFLVTDIEQDDEDLLK